DRDAAGQGVRVAPIGAEAEIVRPHGRRDTGRHGFLAERKVTGAFDQILEKEIVGPLLRLANGRLDPEYVQARLFANIVVGKRIAGHAIASLDNQYGCAMGSSS